MYLGKRWVPIEVMDAIFLLWAIGAIIIAGIMVWLYRKGASSQIKNKPATNCKRMRRRKTYR